MAGGALVGDLVIWIVSVACAALAYRIAAGRGADPVMWAGLGFFFGPLPLPLLLLAPVRRRRSGS